MWSREGPTPTGTLAGAPYPWVAGREAGNKAQVPTKCNLIHPHAARAQAPGHTLGRTWWGGWLILGTGRAFASGLAPDPAWTASNRPKVNVLLNTNECAHAKRRLLLPIACPAAPWPHLMGRIPDRLQSVGRRVAGASPPAAGTRTLLPSSPPPQPPRPSNPGSADTRSACPGVEVTGRSGLVRGSRHSKVPVIALSWWQSGVWWDKCGAWMTSIQP